MAYKLRYSDYPGTDTGPPDPERWVGPVGPTGPQGVPGPTGPPGLITDGDGVYLPLSGGTVTGPLNYIATGGNTVRSAQDRAGEVVNVKDFGAKGDGATDDTAAIQAAIAAGVSRLSGGGSVVIHLPPGIYRCNGSINLTGIMAYNAGMFVIDAWGATISSYAAGLPAIDAISSQCIHINGLTIHGDATAVPSYGLQMGRRDTNDNPADWRTNGLTIIGAFTRAAWLNVGSESGYHSGLRINNAVGDGLWMDGINHANVSSAFQTVTLPVDAVGSFNDNYFTGAVIQTTTGVDLWMAGNSGTRFENGYFSTGGLHNITLHEAGAGDHNRFVHLSIHTETVSVSDVFLVTGTSASVILPGFEYRDFYAEATNSLFKLGGSVTAASMERANLRIGNGTGGWTKVFDNPGAWTVSGDVALDPLSTVWNLPASAFSGTLTTGFAVTHGVATAATLMLNDPVAPMLSYPTQGSATPSFSTRSAGTKVMLYPSLSGSQVDYAIGMAPNTMWFSLPVVGGNYFSWYAGQTFIASLTGTGAFSIYGVGAAYQIDGNQVVKARIQGWSAATGGSKTGLNAATATLPQTAAAVAQLIADLTTHGLIGA